MNILGITGQTGAGKTTLLKAIHEMKGESIDCDALYWQLLQTNETLCARLTKTFTDITSPSGTIDRKKLGQQVFASPDKLLQLNHITHPIILDKVSKLIQCHEKNQIKLLAIDAIALIESGLSKYCDTVLAVTAPKNLRIKRIMTRDNISEEYALNRVESQKPDEFYQENADFILENHFPCEDDFLKYTKTFLRRFENHGR